MPLIELTCSQTNELIYVNVNQINSIQSYRDEKVEGGLADPRTLIFMPNAIYFVKEESADVYNMVLRRWRREGDDERGA